MHRASVFAFCALVGCGAAPRPNAELEAQVRQIRTEQERQARQIELLENRVVLAEDSARAARQAILGSSQRTVRIAPDVSHATEDSIPSAEEAIPGDPNGNDDASDPGANEPPGNRPVIRATGRDTTPNSSNPITVRDEDRLPVAPVPPIPVVPPPAPAGGRHRGAAPRDDGPGSLLPASGTEPLANAAPLPAVVAPGVSSVRDPQSAPAYDAALALARGGRCGEAIDAFSAFLVRWPDHPFADNAMYWRGECILRNGDVRRAATEFEGLIARFPVGNKVPDALYKLIQCYERLGDSARSRSYAARLLREFPQSEVAVRLRAERNAR